MACCHCCAILPWLLMSTVNVHLSFCLMSPLAVLESQPELFIHVAPDKANNTITLTDSGIGMTKVCFLSACRMVMPLWHPCMHAQMHACC